MDRNKKAADTVPSAQCWCKPPLPSHRLLLFSTVVKRVTLRSACFLHAICSWSFAVFVQVFHQNTKWTLISNLNTIPPNAFVRHDWFCDESIWCWLRNAGQSFQEFLHFQGLISPPHSHKSITTRTSVPCLRGGRIRIH